jgi:hypothetical protein
MPTLSELHRITREDGGVVKQLQRTVAGVVAPLCLQSGSARCVYNELSIVAPYSKFLVPPLVVEK